MMSSGKEQGAPGGSNVEKIDHLMRWDESAAISFVDERRLVALVFLSNSNLVPISNLLTAWAAHQHHLLPFCQRLLLGRAEDSPSIAYGRLVCLLLGRLLSCQYEPKDTNFDSSSKALLHLTLKCSHEISNSDKPQAVQFRLEALEMLTNYCTLRRRRRSYDWVDDILTTHMKPIWQDYVQGMKVEQPGQSNHPTISDEQVMEKTVQAIVQRSLGNHPPEEDDVKQRFHSAMETLFRTEVLAALTRPAKTTATVHPTIAGWLRQCLSNLPAPFAKNGNSTACTESHYVLNALPKGYQLSWQETLLLFIRSLAAHPGLDSLQKDISNQVVQLLLIHVVSPGEQSGALRLLAWTTCAAWVDRFQALDWMLLKENVLQPQGKSTDKALGSASRLCALVRLASGEWRIQLGYRLAAAGTDSLNQQERVVMIQACAQVLASTVAYLGQIADDMESGRDNQVTLSPEALLHLRDSLEDTLQATSNYLCQASPSYIDKEDAVIIQLLGTLLSEFDVFDELTNLDTDEILRAVAISMKSCKDLDTQEQIIACLMGILGSARGDSYRVSLLKEHEIVGDGIASFLFCFWTSSMDGKATNLRPIPAACHVTELWHLILTEHQSELRLAVDPSTIKKVLVAWMRDALGRYPTKVNKSDLARTLNASVGCFVTLQGDLQPSEAEAQIVQGAMQFCAI